MTLLDKVKLLIANMQRAITDLTAIKTALIGRGIELPEGTTTSDYANIITNMSSGDADSEAFLDTYQDNGNRRNYDYAFAGEGWTDELYNPKYPIVAESFIGMFRNNDKITSTKVSLDFSNNANEDYKIDQCFMNCSSLVEILTLIVGRKTPFIGSFDGCSSLKDIGFLGELWYDLYLTETEVLSDETLMRLVYIAKDFLNDEDETIQELAWSYAIYLASSAVERLFEIEADERFPEEYQGQLLGDVLLYKGWSF